MTAINKEATRGSVCPLSWILTVEVVNSFVVTSSFSDSIVFAVHSGERFQIDPFSLIVFGVVLWTLAVSGTKQCRFRLKTV